MTTEHDIEQALVDATIHIGSPPPAVLLDAIDKRILQAQREQQACRMLRHLLSEMRLPHTLAGFRCTFLYVDDGYYKFDLALENDGGRQDIAFGTLRKVIDALIAAGWETKQDGIDLTAAPFGRTLTTTISGEREADRLIFNFSGLPEGPHCRLVEETVKVPATTRTVLRVVCEEQETLPEGATP